MIRFKDSLKYACPDVYMDIKISEYWNLLNPMKKNGDPTKNSITNRAKILLDEYLKGNHFQSSASSDREKEQRHIQYLVYLTDNDSQKIKDIIKCKAEDFTLYIHEAFSILNISDLMLTTQGVRKSHSFGLLLLDRVFTYKNTRKSNGFVNFYKRLGLEKKHCFYCNDSEITIISKTSPSTKKPMDNKGRMLFDLDHFYLKSRFPFLALSFYNLIPCCGICNSIFRGVKDFTIKSHINPYLDSFDELYNFLFDEKEIAHSLQSGAPCIKKLELSKKINPTKFIDKTAVDLDIENRNIHNLTNINNLMGDIISYSHKSWDEIAFYLHGYNNHKIPRERSEILNSSKSKLNMDFLDKVKKLF